MEKTLVQITQDTATYTVLTDTTTETVEHILSKNEYGESGYMTGLNADMYRCIAFMFNGNSGMLDDNLTPWNIIDKTGQIADMNQLSSQLNTLCTTLIESGVNTLTSIGYTWDEEKETAYLEFNFSGTTFSIDPTLQSMLR